MKIIYGTALFVAGLFAQWWFSTYASFFGLAPQVLLILTVALASIATPIATECFAFGWGLYLDVMSPHLFGANALLLTLTGYLIGNMRRQMDISSPLSQVLLAGIVSFGYFMALALVGLVFKGRTFWIGWAPFLLDPVLNGITAPFGFLFVRRLMD